MANLIDNAIRHNLPGGEAEITTALSAGNAVITVSNTGTLIPPGEVEDLFQPFWQLGRSLGVIPPLGGPGCRTNGPSR